MPYAHHTIFVTPSDAAISHVSRQGGVAVGFHCCASLTHHASICATVAGKDWAALMDPTVVIAASSLLVAGGGGASLASLDTGAAGAGTAVASGAFGTIRAYKYHGANVAVKELKADAIDAESIGTRCCRAVVDGLSLSVTFVCGATRLALTFVVSVLTWLLYCARTLWCAPVHRRAGGGHRVGVEGRRQRRSGVWRVRGRA